MPYICIIFICIPLIYLAIPLLGIYPEKTIIQKDTCTPVFTEALFTIVKGWKKPRCSLTDEWIKRLWYIHTMDYHSAIKRNEFESVGVRWMNLESVTQSEVRAIYWIDSSVQFSSVAQSCPTLCDPMNRSTPGLPVHHQLPEFTQTHIHRVGDAIQPSHPLSSPSPPSPNPSQHQSLYQWVNSSHEVAKVLEFQL